MLVAMCTPAGEQFGDAGGGLGDGAVDQAIPDRPAAPVVVERLHDDALVAPPLHDLERTRAHGQVLADVLPAADGLDVVLGQDPRADAAQSAQEHRLGRVRVDDDLMGPDDLDLADLAVLAVLLQRRVGRDTLQGELHVLGREGLAVVPQHALAQLEAHRQYRRSAPTRWPARAGSRRRRP
jgi:hypothetical protein